MPIILMKTELILVYVDATSMLINLLTRSDDLEVSLEKIFG